MSKQRNQVIKQGNTHRLKQRKTQSHEECKHNAACCRSRLGPSLAAGHKVSLCDWNVQPFGICAKYDGQNKCLCTVIQECLLEYLFLYMLLVLHICAHACRMQAFVRMHAFMGRTQAQQFSYLSARSIIGIESKRGDDVGWG